MDLKQKIKDLRNNVSKEDLTNYLKSKEVYLGSNAGFIGGLFAGFAHHSSGYINSLHSVQNIFDLMGVNIYYCIKSLDEIIIGTLLGAGVGVAIKYARSRKKS